MQSLATGVGDLKRVLTNVKMRGTWGEVQLGALLEQMLTPEQYREKWGLNTDYPMVAPNYAAARSQLAKQMGLGQQRRRRAK
jgi:DNA anti-recombination protein RmuC